MAGWVGGVTFTKLMLFSTQLKFKLKFELSLAKIDVGKGKNIAGE